MLLHYHKRLPRFSLLALLIGFISLITIRVNAQDNSSLADSIQHKLKLYSLSHPASKLFVHFDKTLYTNNENIWFTAYLLNCNDQESHHTLSVSIVNDIDRYIENQEKFVFSAGIGFGNLRISDTIAPGNYTIVVYTNKLINNIPEALFTQHVTIKHTSTPQMKAILSLADTSMANLNQVKQVLLNVNGNNYLPVANALVNYKIAGSDTAVIIGKAQTDKAGQYTIQIPQGKNMLKVQVRNKRESQYLNMYIPSGQSNTEVLFYPESGVLINKIQNRVGWEVKRSDGMPLEVKGVLYKNNEAIDTVKTDNYGLGVFKIKPEAGNQYSVKILNKGFLTGSAHLLPSIAKNGVGISFSNALVNDTLLTQITATYSGIVYLNVHNYQHSFLVVPIELRAYKSRKVSVLLDKLPKGLSTLTLTDSLGNPYAERVFFAHYNQQEQLKIETDKTTYATREKVTIKLKLNGVQDQIREGVVSVACVQENRIEFRKSNNIESFLYLDDVIGDLALKPKVLLDGKANKDFLEKVFLVRGWRKYNWLSVMRSRPVDSALINATASISGIITINKKALTRPVSFILSRDSSSAIIVTDSKGQFHLTEDQLWCAQDKGVKFILPLDKGYQLTLNDAYVNLNNKLSKEITNNDFDNEPLLIQSSENFIIKGMEHAIQLRAVNVNAVKQKDSRLLYNACGDYVCQYNVLNCQNHPISYLNRAPVRGEKYLTNGVLKVYMGCVESSTPVFQTIHGIYYSKEFYGSDYAVANPTQPEYVSTIYWNHLVKVAANKQAELLFYTGDITGKFKIVVQGITNNGVTYAESSINVVSP